MVGVVHWCTSNVKRQSFGLTMEKYPMYLSGTLARSYNCYRLEIYQLHSHFQSSSNWPAALLIFVST